MKPLIGIITWIKTLAIPAKIAIGATAVAVVGGGTAAVVVTVNRSEPDQVSVQSSEQESDETNTEKSEDEKENSDEHAEDATSNEANSEENTPSQQRETTSNSGKNTTSTNGNTTNSTQNNQSASSQKTETTPTKTADYNLNTPYYLSVWGHRGNYNKCWQTIGDAPTSDSAIGAWSDKFYTPECQGQEASPTIWAIGKSVAEAGRNVEQKTNSQYAHYYFALKYCIYEGVLTEAYCNQYGLSCGRW